MSCEALRGQREDPAAQVLEREPTPREAPVGEFPRREQARSLVNTDRDLKAQRLLVKQHPH
jgi:hypothetical protein